MMLANGNITMRDALLGGLYDLMPNNEKIFIATADLGAPKLDKIRKDFPKRFVNVGIAEQNLVNVSAGLALEGYIVYAMAIAPFLSMRAYEQIRNNLALLSQTKKMNVNLLAVGAGMSYEVSGPSHHALEDLSVIATLPNVTVFSPSDSILAAKFAEYSINNSTPKYARLDGKVLPSIYHNFKDLDIGRGYHLLHEGKDIVLVATGYMTHKAVIAAEKIGKELGVNVSILDLFLMPVPDRESLIDILMRHSHVVTLEEAFVGKGGLDSYIRYLLSDRVNSPSVTGLGLKSEYSFELGNRDELHELSGINVASVVKSVADLLAHKK